MSLIMGSASGQRRYAVVAFNPARSATIGDGHPVAALLGNERGAARDTHRSRGARHCTYRGHRGWACPVTAQSHDSTARDGAEVQTFLGHQVGNNGSAQMSSGPTGFTRVLREPGPTLVYRPVVSMTKTHPQRFVTVMQCR
jgi:hypothetical protein